MPYTRVYLVFPYNYITIDSNLVLVRKYPNKFGALQMQVVVVGILL